MWPLIILGIAFALILMYLFLNTSGGDDDELLKITYSGDADKIKDGKKTIDVRKNHETHQEKIKEGSEFAFRIKEGKKLLKCKIGNVRHYSSLDEAVEKEDGDKLHPGESDEEFKEEVGKYMSEEELRTLSESTDGKPIVVFDFEFIEEMSNE